MSEIGQIILMVGIVMSTILCPILCICFIRLDEIVKDLVERRDKLQKEMRKRRWRSDLDEILNVDRLN